MTDDDPPIAPQSEAPVDLLSAKERAFVDAYGIHRNAAQAAREAGYSEKWAKQQGSRLLERPKVRKAVEAALEQLTADAGVTAKWVVARLKKIASEDGNDRVKACELLGKHLRLWREDSAEDVGLAALVAAAAVGEAARTTINITPPAALSSPSPAPAPRAEDVGRAALVTTDPLFEPRGRRTANVRPAFAKTDFDPFARGN